MIHPALNPFRPRRGRLRPPDTLTLVRATYVAGTSLTLTFDRPIDITALDGGQVVVSDGPSGMKYDGAAGAALVDPQTVELSLADIDGYAGPDVRLTAGATTGIAAADGGPAWAGASNLLLPYP